MKTQLPFGDVNSALMEELVQRFPERLADMPDGRQRVRDVLPTEPVRELGHYVRVAGLGGTDTLTTDSGTHDIDVFAPTYEEAWALATDIRAYMLRYPRRVETGARLVVLGEVRTSMRPQVVDWEDRTITRIYSSYWISARR